MILHASLLLIQPCLLATPIQEQSGPSQATLLAGKSRVRELIASIDSPQREQTLSWFDSTRVYGSQNSQELNITCFTDDREILRATILPTGHVQKLVTSRESLSGLPVENLSQTRLQSIADAIAERQVSTDYVCTARVRPGPNGEISSQFSLVTQLKVRPDVQRGLFVDRIVLHPKTGDLMDYSVSPPFVGPSRIREEYVHPRHSMAELERTAKDLYASVDPFPACTFRGRLVFLSPDFTGGHFLHEMTPFHRSLVEQRLGMTFYLGIFVGEPGSDTQFCFIDSLTNRPVAWWELKFIGSDAKEFERLLIGTCAVWTDGKKWRDIRLSSMNPVPKTDGFKKVLLRQSGVTYAVEVSPDGKVIKWKDRWFRVEGTPIKPGPVPYAGFGKSKSKPKL